MTYDSIIESCSVVHIPDGGCFRQHRCKAEPCGAGQHTEAGDLVLEQCGDLTGDRNTADVT
ncbi:hypothetical protein [Ralstonia phage phiRSL1]|uniref:Uncharacterized protein n=1 Tax=Ralstonia phage phiRSL1 TaxID=1980924 RepID=B2ZY45_9CAUD|nr:hypothetical protein RSL1_ORF191 [Ralstonia phage phiRSL1]BAG41640.1 hypothetical protein [Ralstonia phage phiRSL1]